VHLVFKWDQQWNNKHSSVGRKHWYNEWWVDYDWEWIEGLVGCDKWVRDEYVF
jgi:hypothetical protein